MHASFSKSSLAENTLARNSTSVTNHDAARNLLTLSRLCIMLQGIDQKEFRHTCLSIILSVALLIINQVPILSAVIIHSMLLSCAEGSLRGEIVSQFSASGSSLSGSPVSILGKEHRPSPSSPAHHDKKSLVHQLQVSALPPTFPLAVLPTSVQAVQKYISFTFSNQIRYNSTLTDCASLG